MIPGEASMKLASPVKHRVLVVTRMPHGTPSLCARPGQVWKDCPNKQWDRGREMNYRGRKGMAASNYEALFLPTDSTRSPAEVPAAVTATVKIK